MNEFVVGGVVFIIAITLGVVVAAGAMSLILYRLAKSMLGLSKDYIDKV